MTVTLSPLAMSSIEETPKTTTSRHGAKSRLTNLYRTNTFPRVKKREWRRSVSAIPEGHSAADNVSPPYSPTSDCLVSNSGSNAKDATSSGSGGGFKGFKRGFSEQFSRIGRGTLDRIGRLNRVRKLAGMFYAIMVSVRFKVHFRTRECLAIWVISEIPIEFC